MPTFSPGIISCVTPASNRWSRSTVGVPLPVEAGAPVVPLKAAIEVVDTSSVGGGVNLTRVAGVQRRALEQLVFHRDPRTRLIGAHQAVVQVEAHAVVERQLFRRLPFVLDVAAVNPGLQRDVVDDPKGTLGGLFPAVSGTPTRGCRSRRARRRSNRPAETYDWRFHGRRCRAENRCPSRCEKPSTRRRYRSGRQRDRD